MSKLPPPLYTYNEYVSASRVLKALQEKCCMNTEMSKQDEDFMVELHGRVSRYEHWPTKPNVIVNEEKETV